ncbi:MAG: hypothetical protein RL427_1027 [Bacteroidota bacterium]|jgi:hypothetical protein
MFKFILSRKLNERVLYGIALCVVIYFIGHFILNKISTLEDPPMGNTIYILVGNVFVFGSILGVLLLIKYKYDETKKKNRRERKRKNHKIYFLKNKGNESTGDTTKK